MTRNAVTILRHLRAHARPWAGPPNGTVAQIGRRDVRTIRETLANGGWLQLGRGGSTLHPEPHRTISGHDNHSISALIAAGIPTLDSRNMGIRDVAELAIAGPMPGFAPDPWYRDPDGALSTVHWSTVFNRYAARPGAIFYNYSPTPEHWTARKPEEVTP